MSLPDNLPQSAYIQGFWKLNEESSTRYDETDNDNDLTDNNTVLYSSSGKIGNCANFERSNSEYLSIADGSQIGLDPTDEMSFLIWVKLESINVAHGVLMRLNSYHCFVGSDNKATLRAYYNGSNYVPCESSDTLSTGTWYHLGFVVRGDVVQVYIDGSPNGTPGNFSGKTINDSNEDIWMGGWEGQARYLDGLADEGIFWGEKGLTDEEVAEVYNITSWRYDKTNTGILVPVGTSIKKTSKKPIGTLNFTGIVSKIKSHLITGILTFAGLTKKKIKIIRNGIITFSGSISAKIVFQILLEGILNFSGLIIRKTKIIRTGILTFAGSILKGIYRTLTGILTFSGIAKKKMYQIIEGIINFSGLIRKKAIKLVNGVITFSSTISKIIKKINTGVLTLTGVTKKKTLKLLAGAINFSGLLKKKISKLIEGILSFLGVEEEEEYLPATFDDWEEVVNDHTRQWQLYSEIYFDGDNETPVAFDSSDIVGWDLLEEAYADSNTPLGAVSSNELIVTLDNSNGYFTPTNTSSPYYGKLLPNLLIVLNLKIKIDDEFRYISLGEYRTGDWSAPSDSLEAEVICHDDVYTLGQKKIPQIPAMQSVNLQTIWRYLLLGLDLDLSDFEIDEFTQGISIGWFLNENVLNNFQKLVERGAGAMYGMRDSIIKVKSYYYPEVSKYTWTDNNQIINADLPQNYENVYSRVKVNYYQPYVDDTSTLLNMDYTVPAGGTTLERLQVSFGPIGIIEGINIVGAENVSIDSITAGMWDITLELGNSGDEEDIVIEVVGRKISYNISSVTVEDTDLYDKIGDVTLEINNHLVQSKTEATSLANYILQLVSDPVSYISIKARGDPYIKLTETMTVDYENGNINDLDIIPIRLHHTFRDGLDAEVEGIKKSVRELT